MKIVYLHQYFKTPAEAGGTRSHEMARRFAAAGHDVHVVTTRTRGDLDTGWVLEQVEGFTVHWLRVDYDNSMGFRRRIWAFLIFALRSSARARRLRGDVVIATSTPLTIAIPGLWATAMSRSRLVFEVRDLWPQVPIALGFLRNPILRALARGLERLAYRRSVAVVALSADMAAGVNEVIPSKPVVVIPNAADNELFDVDENAGRAFRDDRPWLGDRPLILYAGAIGMVNGVSYMAHLASEYRKLDGEARFLVVGDGAERKQVIDLARSLGVLEETFFIEQPVPKSAMPAVMSAADICASWIIPVPELEANSANKFFDSMAAGRPIVVNHGGWQAKLIRTENIGVVLPADDHAAAARQLHNFMTDPQAVKVARQHSARLAREEFNRDRLAERLLAVLEEAAPRARAQHHEENINA